MFLPGVDLAAPFCPAPLNFFAYSAPREKSAKILPKWASFLAKTADAG
jgi:hypothetical protein